MWHPPLLVPPPPNVDASLAGLTTVPVDLNATGNKATSTPQAPVDEGSHHYVDAGSGATVDVSPPASFVTKLVHNEGTAAWNIRPVFTDPAGLAITTIRGLYEGVVVPTHDWVADMSSGGPPRDHSEAMTGALGTVVLMAIMPGERVVVQASEEVATYKEGSFSIIDWTGYPANMERPAGPFRIISGKEYDMANATKISVNKAIIKAKNLQGSGHHIHEIQPVEFGGSPTDPANKAYIPWQEHIGQGGVHPQFWTPLRIWIKGK